ncbi:hypothetical protein SIO70_26345 [Chitinophaga sancti]|uniref:hypothetical protein n=1 Tax=Chitinophaga sancti TaxID=1004 RepID=UPI002A762652|nr:hypothetical protein [Chitinophaga sancti]WPQ61886.1 hypothetical protein SIO70_26345 [Chitinophaga sancti]
MLKLKAIVYLLTSMLVTLMANCANHYRPLDSPTDITLAKKTLLKSGEYRLCDLIKQARKQTGVDFQFSGDSCMLCMIQTSYPDSISVRQIITVLNNNGCLETWGASDNRVGLHIFSSK